MSAAKLKSGTVINVCCSIGLVKKSDIHCHHYYRGYLCLYRAPEASLVIEHSVSQDTLFGTLSHEFPRSVNCILTFKCRLKLYFLNLHFSQSLSRFFNRISLTGIVGPVWLDVVSQVDWLVDGSIGGLCSLPRLLWTAVTYWFKCRLVRSSFGYAVSCYLQPVCVRSILLCSISGQGGFPARVGIQYWIEFCCVQWLCIWLITRCSHLLRVIVNYWYLVIFVNW